jgi:hypothetical protein
MRGGADSMLDRFTSSKPLAEDGLDGRFASVYFYLPEMSFSRRPVV